MAQKSSGALRAPMPARIGDFRILRVLGEGGMGVVYEAEQERPHRKVALKVIRAARLTPETSRRFDREAQVLALLQHPGIAQIYQAGTADTGQGLEPYFAMELVQGDALLTHVEARGFSLEQRLELFARVCDALHHAHQKGVVHRDLKPGNILVVDDVSSSDSLESSASARPSSHMLAGAPVGQPKILDFGLARLTEESARANTLQTEVGQILGTVQYMSPEQVLGNSELVDARSDIYSLGVVGYQLVSGRLPHALAGQPMLEAMRVIRDDDPTPLSSIDRKLKGDVETIFGKALEKDPARRYATAADLAADVRRFLRSEPIVARPASTAYQLRKFAARNRVLVGAIVAVFVALSAGLIGTWKGFVEARASAELAIERGNQARAAAAEAQLAREDALAAAAEAQAINDFLVDGLLAASNPNVAKGREMTVEDVLENARDEAEHAFADQPLLAARLHATLGEIELRLGRFADAERHFRQVWTSRAAGLGADAPQTMDASTMLARSLRELERYDEALELQRAYVDWCRDRGEKLLLARALTIYAQTLISAGDPRGAQAAFDEAIVLLESHAPAAGDRNLLPTLLSDRASLRAELGQVDEARADYQRALELFERAEGDMHPDVARIRAMLAAKTHKDGEWAQTQAELESVAAMQRRMFAHDHPDLAMTYSLLADAALDAGDYALAEVWVRAGLSIRDRVAGVDTHGTARQRIVLARALSALGRNEEAANELDAALLVLEAAEGNHDHVISNALFQLALARRGLGDIAAAGEAAQEALCLRENVVDVDRRDVAQALSLVAQIHHARAEHDEAERRYREVRDLYAELLGERDLNVAIGDVNLASLLLDRERPTEAEASARRGFESAAAVLDPSHPTLAAIGTTLARALRKNGRLDEALEHFERALDTQRARLPAGHAATLGTLVELGDLLVELDRAAQAEPMLREAVEGRRAQRPPDVARSARATGSLGQCLRALARPTEAEPLLVESWTAWSSLETRRADAAAAARHLAELCAELGRAEDADRWRAAAATP